MARDEQGISHRRAELSSGVDSLPPSEPSIPALTALKHRWDQSRRMDRFPISLRVWPRSGPSGHQTSAHEKLTNVAWIYISYVFSYYRGRPSQAICS